MNIFGPIKEIKLEAEVAILMGKTEIKCLFLFNGLLFV